MSNLKVVLNRSGVRELLKSEEMQEILREQAQKISGSDGETEVYVAQTRAVATATGDHGNNELLKKMGK